MTIKIAQIEAHYDDHMGNDISVLNAARQSFNKRKPKDAPVDEKDRSLIEFLATGMRTKEWDAFLDQITELAVAYNDAEAFTFSEQGAKEALKQALIAYKRKAQHWAPFAHPHVTISIRVPIFLARQLVKHQIGGTWSEESRRYMSSEVEYYFEPVLHTRPEDIKQGSEGDHADTEKLLEFMRGVSFISNERYNYLLKEGVAPEEAREILTLNSMTGVTWTGSLLFWARLVTQRVDPHAQKAAQRFARQIDSIVRPLYPVSWQALVGTVEVA